MARDQLRAAAPALLISPLLGIRLLTTVKSTLPTLRQQNKPKVRIYVTLIVMKPPVGHGKELLGVFFNLVYNSHKSNQYC